MPRPWLLPVLLCVAMSASADVLIYEHEDGLKVEFSKKPCRDDAMLRKLLAKSDKQARVAQVQAGDKRYESCWTHTRRDGIALQRVREKAECCAPGVERDIRRDLQDHATGIHRHPVLAWRNSDRAAWRRRLEQGAQLGGGVRRGLPEGWRDGQGEQQE